jgi:TatD DNase family protein
VIDFHCHIDLYPEPRDVVHACVSKGLYVLAVTTTPSAWAGTSAVVGDAVRIRMALGLHPQLAHQRKGEVELFERLLPLTRYVGEIGLDGSPEFKRHWKDQLNVFTRVLDACARAGGRILSIHSRRAAAPVLDAIENNAGAGTFVMHWFSGTQGELARADDLGCWFSVGPAMLEGEKGRALAARMPRDRILTESDGPFAQVAGRPAMPWDVESAVMRLAETWRVPIAQVHHTLNGNARRLLQDADPAPERLVG